MQFYPTNSASKYTLTRYFPFKSRAKPEPERFFGKFSHKGVDPRKLVQKYKYFGNFCKSFKSFKKAWFLKTIFQRKSKNLQRIFSGSIGQIAMNIKIYYKSFKNQINLKENKSSKICMVT